MTRTRYLYLFGALVAAPSMLVALTAGGCAGKNSTGSGGTGGATHTTSTAAGGGGNQNTAGGGQGGDVTCGVGAVEVTIQQITDDTAQGHVGPGVDVHVTGAVAMSQKFLVSKGGSGSCLWGVFVSAPNITTTAPHTGILLLSYGTQASTPDGGSQSFCPLIEDGPVGDAIPDDIQPGDVININGESDKFLLSQCASQPNGSEVGQFQISKACRVTKTGTAAVPAAAVVNSADYTDFVDQTLAAQAFHDQWGGVKVRLSTVSATDGAGGSSGTIVGQYGIITLDQPAASGIQIGDKVFYEGAFKATDVCKAGPVFDVNPGGTQNFTFVDGFHYLDFCTWSLAVNDKCSDYSPQSQDCTAATCAPY